MFEAFTFIPSAEIETFDFEPDHLRLGVVGWEVEAATHVRTRGLEALWERAAEEFVRGVP